MSRFSFKHIRVVGLAVLMLGLGVIPTLAQTAPLTVVVRDSYGKALAGVSCEVLSYDWGLQVGQAYGVIARGETDLKGSVTFDASNWPNSGYRFKFSPTPRLNPANTFFDPNNQYRGYPAAYVGGKAETQYFFIAADGLPYNDLSEGQGAPTFQRDPVGGLDQPRLTLMPSQNYLATVKAGTLAAQARGEPTSTLPPPPLPFKGVAGPLTLTPGANTVPAESNTGQATPGATVTGVVSQTTGVRAVSSPTYGNNLPVSNPQAATGNLLGSIFMAILGVGSFYLFLKYQHWLYFWLGLERQPVINAQKKRARTKNPNIEKTAQIGHKKIGGVNKADQGEEEK